MERLLPAIRSRQMRATIALFAVLIVVGGMGEGSVAQDNSREESVSNSQGVTGPAGEWIPHRPTSVRLNLPTNTPHPRAAATLTAEALNPRTKTPTATPRQRVKATPKFRRPATEEPKETADPTRTPQSLPAEAYPTNDGILITRTPRPVATERLLPREPISATQTLVPRVTETLRSEEPVKNTATPYNEIELPIDASNPSPAALYHAPLSVNSTIPADAIRRSLLARIATQEEEKERVPEKAPARGEGIQNLDGMDAAEDDDLNGHGFMPNFIMADAGLWTGSAVASIPIDVLPGPNGLTPSLSLAYSSNVAEDVYFQEELASRREDWLQIQASPYGYGWNLTGIPEIRRVPAVTDDFGDSDSGGYELTIGGQTIRLIKPAHDTMARNTNADTRKVYQTYPQSFMYVAKTTIITETTACGLLPNYTEYRWEVITEDGILYEFGGNDNLEHSGTAANCTWADEDRNAVQLMGFGGSIKPSRWFVTRIEDTHGNNMRFTYRRETDESPEFSPDDYDSAITLSEITYGGDTPSTHRSKVKVIEQDGEREDCLIHMPPAEEWHCGDPPDDVFGYRSKKLIDRIEVQYKDDTTWETVRVYNMDYLIHERDDPSENYYERALLEGVTVSSENFPEEPKPGTATPAPTPSTTPAPPSLPSYTMDYYRDALTINWIPLKSFNNGIGGKTEYAYSGNILVECRTSTNGTPKQHYRRRVTSKTVYNTVAGTPEPVSKSEYTYDNAACSHKFVIENQGAYGDWYEFLGYGEVTEKLTDMNQTTTVSDDTVLEHNVAKFYRCREHPGNTDYDCDEHNGTAYVPLEPHPAKGQVREEEVWDGDPTASGQIMAEEQYHIEDVDLTVNYIGMVNSGTVSSPWARLDRVETHRYGELNASSTTFKVLKHIAELEYETAKQGDTQWGRNTARVEFLSDDNYNGAIQVPYRSSRAWYKPTGDSVIDESTDSFEPSTHTFILDRPIAEAMFEADSEYVADQVDVKWNYYDDNALHTDGVDRIGALTRTSKLEKISSLPAGVSISGCTGTYDLYRTSDAKFVYNSRGNVQDSKTYSDYGYICIKDPGQPNENILVHATLPSAERKTSFEYEADLNALVKKETNPELHVQEWKYYGLNSIATPGAGYFIGNLHEKIDANGNSMSYTYDELGRLSTLIRPGDSSSYPSVAVRYSDDDYSPAFPTMREVWRKREGGSSSPWTDKGSFERTFYDGLGREIQSQRPDFDWDSTAETGNDVLSHVKLDAKGRAVETNNPFTKSAYEYISNCGDPGQAACVNPYATPAASVPKSEVTYDVMNRPLDVTDPESRKLLHRYGVDSSEFVWQENLIDENQHRKLVQSDSLGRMDTVTDYTGECGSDWSETTCGGGETAWVADGGVASYFYDEMDRLVSISDDNSDQSYITYDMLGRKTELDDVQLGIWAYNHDAAGNLTYHIDARDQKVCRFYDSLDRLTEKRYFDDSTACSTSGGTAGPEYAYDESFGGAGKKGQRTSMDMADGAWYKWYYDSRGRMEGEDQYLPGTGGGTYYTDYEYNSDDSLSLIDRPDAFEDVEYEYSPAGLDRMHNSNPLYGISATTYVDGTEYTAAGQVSKRLLGSGSNQIRETHTYDPDDLRLTSNLVETVTGGNDRQELEYIYDPHGNITEITDKEAGGDQDQEYIYDEQNRLTSAYVYGGTGGTYPIEYYDYDTIGNITEKAGIAYKYHADKTAAARKRYSAGSTTTPQLKMTAWIQPACTWSVWVDVIINGTVLGNYNVTQTSPTLLTLGSFALTGHDVVKVAPSSGGFNTNCWINIDDLTINGVPIEAEGGQAAFDSGNSIDGIGMKTPVKTTNLSRTVLKVGENGGLLYARGSKAAAYEYDENGNVIWRVVDGAAYNLVWDEENRLDKILQGEETSSVVTVADFSYDGDDKRIKKIRDAANGTETTFYVGDLYEYTEASYPYYHKVYAASRYRAEDERVAIRSGAAWPPSPLYWVLTDHLGSTTKTILASSGSMDEEMRYKAWGETRYPVTPAMQTERLYTGQREEDGVGLYYYGARYYDPMLSRFISPDTLVPDPGNPQDLNRYSYVRNNPVKYNDPSGNILDTALDVAFLVADVRDIRANGLNWTNGLALAADAVGAVVPFATGGGLAVRAIIKADRALGVIDASSGLAASIEGGSASGAAMGVVGLAGPRIGSTLGARHGDNIPVLEIDRSRMPNVADNIDAAISEGLPSILHREKRRRVQDRNRNEACRGFCGSGSPDEYPFASSMEGGAGARVQGVPLREQRRQGGVISSFYRKHAIGQGDPFKVRVVGKE